MKDWVQQVLNPLEQKPGFSWWFGFLIAFSMLCVGLFSTVWSLYYGTGVWGNNNPVGWAFPIVNFVFWIGIGHAGTLISAVLYLSHQNWRSSIARFAEAMTLFAVITAAIFPVIHMGRPWLAHYLIPYPNERGLWVNFTSPLLWDVFAISTYGIVSAIFWYVGLIPDLGLLRDRAKRGLRKSLYALFSLGWRNSGRHWHHYEKTYLILAGIATPLVFSVHTIVSYDFATAIIPGWHSTLFPPYFVAGAVFSGLAMVEIALIVLRKSFHLELVIRIDHLEMMNKLILTTSLMVGFAYFTEIFMAWYLQNSMEVFVQLNRAFGPYNWAFGIMIFFNVLFPQLFWFQKVRRNILFMLMIALGVNVGMWFERFVIVVTSLQRDFLPSSWGIFKPTWVDFGLLIGSFGLFFTFVFLFVRLIPAVSISESRGSYIKSQPSLKVREGLK